MRVPIAGYQRDAAKPHRVGAQVFSTSGPDLPTAAVNSTMSTMSIRWLTILIMASVALAACDQVAPTATGIPVLAPEATFTPTLDPTATFTPTPTDLPPTPTPTPTATPTPSPTATPTATPTPSPTPTATPTPTPTPTPTFIVYQIRASCPTNEERAEIDRDFNISFDPEIFMPYECATSDEPIPEIPDLAGVVDIGGNAQLTVYQVFRVMKAMEFDEPLPWTGESLYDWLRNAVAGVHFSSGVRSSCCKEERVIVIGGAQLDHPIRRTWDGIHGIVRVMAHEARHAEGFVHTCGSNDETFGELGALAVHHYVDLWVAEHSAPGLYSQYEKDKAALDAEFLIDKNICRYSLEFVDDQNGWASGGLGGILKTDDGGRTWSSQSSGIRGQVKALSFADHLSGWAVDSEGILHTADGGITWSPQGPVGRLFGDRGPLPSELEEVYFLNATKGWVIVVRSFLHTEDGGATWSTQVVPPFFSDCGVFFVGKTVVFTDPEYGWISGDRGAVGYTMDGGSTWACQLVWKTTGSRLEVPWLRDMDFVDRSNGWVVGGRGTIFHTPDGGVTWNPQVSGVTGRLFGVDFVDTQRGWVVGENGAILHTRDGGMTWTIQDSSVTSFLWDVAFVSEQEGWVVGDGGLILHTEDGGSSWVVQREP